MGQQSLIGTSDLMLGHKLRVLVLMDTDQEYELVIRVLQDGGYNFEAKQIKTDREMQEALKNPDWDLVLSNFRMEAFGAIEALDSLEKSGVVLPFIIFSDFLESQD
ncbi:MAG: hypothetical protein MUO76_24455, partial [Anaerolineaceae bacterium]|nr:hypothetical protein [Anaerolineaceae bacterium]